jgi:hypothetical protein
MRRMRGPAIAVQVPAGAGAATSRRQYRQTRLVFDELRAVGAARGVLVSGRW